MPANERIPVKRLGLDLGNYRTLPQRSERQAVEAIIAINPDWFWALAESLLEDGYLPTENILVLRSTGKPALVVKEGNRRIAVLKLIHGQIPLTGLPVPSHIVEKISAVPTAWKRTNTSVPCVVYEASEVSTVNRIRSLTHGKGEKAGRDAWTPVARARHNRDENKASEPALDLLEKYLKLGRNVTPAQAQRWAGDYRLTVLEEAMKRLATRLGAANSPELGKIYPNIQHRDGLEAIIHDIGQLKLSFESIRSQDVGVAYGIPQLPTKGAGGSPAKSLAGKGTSSGSNSSGASQSTTNQAGGASTAAAKKVAAVAIHDPRQVARQLKSFAPKGRGREKVVSLLLELRNLKLDKNPIAFCFLLRSMFEISAKVYCTENKSVGLTATKSDGSDRKLVDVLRDITVHLTKNQRDQAMTRQLHGAMTELGKATGILSVTSMNQLVHNATFAHQPSDIAILFGSVFPLLEALNS